jgi:hypothetical protein
MSRYSKTCPVCGAVIITSEVPYQDSFPCPSCSEWLTYDKRYSPAIWVTSFITAILISLHLGYRDVPFMIAVWCATFLIGLLGIFLVGILFPPALKRATGEPFDKTVSLNLSDKSENDKKADP